MNAYSSARSRGPCHFAASFSEQSSYRWFPMPSLPNEEGRHIVVRLRNGVYAVTQILKAGFAHYFLDGVEEATCTSWRPVGEAEEALIRSNLAV